MCMNATPLSHSLFSSSKPVVQGLPCLAPEVIGEMFDLSTVLVRILNETVTANDHWRGRCQSREADWWERWLIVHGHRRIPIQIKLIVWVLYVQYIRALRREWERLTQLRLGMKTKEGERERVSFDPWCWLCGKDGRQGGRGCDVRTRIDVVGSDFAQRGECIWRQWRQWNGCPLRPERWTLNPRRCRLLTLRLKLSKWLTLLNDAYASFSLETRHFDRKKYWLSTEPSQHNRFRLNMSALASGFPAIWNYLLTHRLTVDFTLAL